MYSASVCLPVCVSVCLPVCALSVYLSVCLSVLVTLVYDSQSVCFCVSQMQRIMYSNFIIYNNNYREPKGSFTHSLKDVLVTV